MNDTPNSDSSKEEDELAGKAHDEQEESTLELEEELALSEEVAEAQEGEGTLSEALITFVPLNPVYLKQSTVAFFVLAAAIFLYRLRVLSSISTHAFGGSSRDAGLYLWLFEQGRSLFSLPWFDTAAFYPYGMTLAWSDNFLLPSLFGALPALIGADTLTSYNLTLLFALLLNGFCTFYLAQRITGAFFASLITGLGFSFYSFFTHHAGHPQLLFFFFIPLSLLWLIHYVATLKRRWLFASFLCIPASFLCSVYYALFLALLLPAFLLGLYLVRPYYFGKRQFFDLLLMAGLACVPLLPFLYPYLETKALFGGRKLYEPFFFSATGLSYLSVTEHHSAYGSVFAGLSNEEAALFPGFTVIVFLIAALKRLGVAKKIKHLGQITVLSVFLALLFSELGAYYEAFYYSATFFTWLSIVLAAFFLRALGALERSREYYVVSNRNFIGIFLFCGLLFLCLSLGPIGNVAEGHYVFSPFAALFSFAPGYNALRAAGRLGIVAIWCVFMTLPFLLPLIRGKKGWGTGFYVLTVFLVLAENICSTYPLEEPPRKPAAYHIADQTLDEADALLALPVSPRGVPDVPGFEVDAYARHSVNTMLWSASGQYKLVNGYSGQISAMHKNLARRTVSFPDPRSLAAIGAVSNLNHIVYHGEEVTGFDAATFEQSIENSSQLSIVDGSRSPTYLIEFTPETRLTDGFRLLLPSHESGNATLELKALYQENSPDISVDIFIEDYYEDAPFMPLLVAANDTYESYSFHLPQTSQNMKPLKIYFKSSAPGQLYLRKRSFSTEKH